MWPQSGPHEVASTDLEDDIHFQPILQDIADYTVVLLRADNQANLGKSTYVSWTIVNGMRNKNTE